MSAHPPILLGNLGMTDSLILMVMALVVFGPRRLPQIGRQIGKLMYEFRKASNDFKFQMEEELRNSEDAERRKKDEERQRSVAALTAAQQASVSADPLPPSQTIESVSPGEGSYPPQALADEARTSEATPRIMPPSVGETVGAAKPSRAIAPGSEPSVEATAATGDNSVAKVNSSSQAEEALNQHG
jgi:sec-independent protein translocase protein TatB